MPRMQASALGVHIVALALVAALCSVAAAYAVKARPATQAWPAVRVVRAASTVPLRLPVCLTRPSGVARALASMVAPVRTVRLKSPLQQTPPAPAAVAPAEPERPPLQEILPPAELNRLKVSADNLKRDIRKVLYQQDPRKLNDSQKALVAQIRGFVQQSDEAEGKGDVRVAESLAQRAEILLRELQGGR